MGLPPEHKGTGGAVVEPARTWGGVQRYFVPWMLAASKRQTWTRQTNPTLHVPSKGLSAVEQAAFDEEMERHNMASDAPVAEEPEIENYEQPVPMTNRRANRKAPGRQPSMSVGGMDEEELEC